MGITLDQDLDPDQMLVNYKVWCLDFQLKCNTLLHLRSTIEQNIRSTQTKICALPCYLYQYIDVNTIRVPSLCITNCAVHTTGARLKPESSTWDFSAQPSSRARAPDVNQHFWRHQLTGIYQISRYIYLKIFTLLSEILVWFWWQGLNNTLLFACWYWSLRVLQFSLNCTTSHPHYSSFLSHRTTPITTDY